MSSHVPFLAVRPDEQFATDAVKKIASKTPKTPKALTANATQPMDSPPPLTPAPPHTKASSKIPASVRLPLVVALSLGLSALLHTVTVEVTGQPLAPASRALREPWQIAALLSWKVGEIFIAWGAGYDYEDIAALTLLTNQPYYYLLHSFWEVNLVSVGLSLGLDIAVVAIPFALLRPLQRAHAPNTPRTTNQSLATDWQIMLLTAGLGAVVYAVTFSLSYLGNLTSFLITHFDDMVSMQAAHDSTIWSLLQLFAFTGIAAMMFLFRPTIAAAGKPAMLEAKSKSRKAKKFNPATASLSETVMHNLGYGETGWSHRAEVLAKRTLVLTACTLANTFVRVFGTVQGTDMAGAVGYAGVWAAANVLVALAYAGLSNEV